jgi:hypothetical protein
LPTGAGKTEALKVLCASASPQNRTGILIVTKFIPEADKLARDINKYCGEQIALAVHSEVKVTQDQINSSPVLITTHSAYRNALIELADNDGPQMQWDRLNCYVQADRRWLIIDEAFDWVQSFQIDFSEIGSLCAALNGIPAFESDIGLKQLTEFVRSLIERSRQTSADWPLNELHRQQLRSLDIDALRSKLVGLSYTELDIWTNIDKPKSAMRKAYSAVLQELKLIHNTDVCWVSKRGKRIHLNSSRLLIDVAKKRGVILDATAAVDKIYELMGSRVELLERPTGIRNYSNVTLNLSTGHRVGKECPSSKIYGQIAA